MEIVIFLIRKKYSYFWLGRCGSEPRMVVPKTTALPLGYAPIQFFDIPQKMKFK